MRRLADLTLMVMLVGASAAGPLCASASATVLHGSDAATYSFSYDDCGFPVDVAGMFLSLHSKARVGKHDLASAFFGHDNYTVREVHTRRDTGAVLVITDQALSHDVKATRVEGSVFRFTMIEVGRFQVATGDGTIVSRDRGQIRRVFLFDTLGDSTPGGQFIELLSEQFHGQFGDFDLCAAFGGP